MTPTEFIKVTSESNGNAADFYFHLIVAFLFSPVTRKKKMLALYLSVIHRYVACCSVRASDVVERAMQGASDVQVVYRATVVESFVIKQEKKSARVGLEGVLDGSNKPRTFTQDTFNVFLH